MQKKLILRVVSFYRKYPKKRNIAIAMLFVIVFFGLLYKYFKAGARRLVPKIAAFGAFFLAFILVPTSLTIGSDEIIVDVDVTGYADNIELYDQNAIAMSLPDLSELELVKTELPWNFALYDTNNAVPADYTFDKKKVRSGCYVDKRIYNELQAMLSAAADQGYTVFVCSAYRSADRQSELFSESVETAVNNGMSDEEAYDYAASQYSEPGNSEHQAGLSVDIVPLSQQVLDEELGDTEEEQWLAANCYKYGFILRYPKDRESITGITYEPWHYRYVGTEAAAYIMENDITLEEYLDEFYSDHTNSGK